MSEATPRLDRDDARRRAYLLGTLSSEEQDGLEARLFADEDELAAVMETQYDLIDAYTRDELAADERRQVEERLLATPEGRRHERAARALQRHATGQPQTSARPAWQRVLPAAALIAASLIAIVWLGYDNLQLRQQLQTMSTSRPTAPAPVSPVPPEPESVIAQVTLSPQVLRGEQSVQVLRVPPEARVVRVALPIDDQADTFTVALERAGVGRTFSQANVEKTTDGTLVVWLSRDALGQGNYEALVWRGDEALANLVGVYRFRVAQP